MRKLITQEYYNLIIREFPSAKENPAYFKLLCYLAFGRLNKKTGQVIIDYSRLARIQFGNKIGIKKVQQLNYKALTFLEEFQRDVMSEETFTWSDYDFEEHRAREAEVTWSDTMIKAIEEENLYRASTTKLNGLVYIDSGKKYSQASIKLARDMDLQMAQQQQRIATDEQKPLLEYMHSLSIKHFSNIVNDSNFYAAIQEVLKIEKLVSRQHQFNTLLAIRENLKPLYQPSKTGNTVRIFAYNGESILSLKKSIRKELCKGWVEFDLASAQLAIVSQTWNIPFIRDYLNNGNKIWKDLCNHLNLPYTEDIKADLKVALYALVYGKTVTKLQQLIKETIGEEYVDLWLSHPVIKAILAARKIKIEQLLRDKQLTTIFGKTIKITGKDRTEINAKIRSALAEESQAVEYYLILPVLELAQSTKDFVITLVQADGFSCSFTNKTKQQRWIDRILQSVQQRADLLSIPTHLELEIL
jgi:hypothetical protein